jgi:hypothetical protein
MDTDQDVKVDAQLEKGRRRVSGQQAMKLAQVFANEAHQLVIVLGQCDLKIVSGTEVTWLLESLNFNGYYDELLVK